MSVKSFVFSLLLLLSGLLLSCQTPTDNRLNTHVEIARDWSYCWPTAPASSALSAEVLLQRLPQDCKSTWKAIYPPLNPPGRGSDREQKQWLWLKLEVPPLSEGTDYLYVRGVDEAFSVYAGDQEIYHFGDFSPERIWYQGFPWHMVPLEPEYAGKPLYFLVHSKYRHIGIFGSPRLGSKAAHLYQMLYMDLDRVVVGGLLIFTGVMVFLLFISQPIVGYEWLCLFAITIGIYLVMRTEIKQLYWYAPALTKWIEVVSLYIAVPSVTFFLSQIFSKQQERLWTHLIQVQGLVSVGSLFLAAVGMISIQQTTGVFLAMTLLNMLLGLVIVLRGFREFGRSGWFAMAGIVALCGFTGYDIMASLKWVPWIRPVTHWGVLAMFISLVLFVKQQVDELYHAKRVAETSDRMKTSFLTNFSHEIRTPLNAIIGFSDLLKKNPPLEKVTEYSAIISDSGKSLLNMINDILDLGKIESNRLELSSATFRLSRLGEQMYQLFSLEAKKKGVDWEVSLAENIPELMKLDGGKLRQVLINLLGNAFKFTETGAVSLHFSYQQRSAEGVLTVTVKDSGIGIQAEQLEQIYQPFYQADHTLQRRFSGTGLGLTITQRLIHLMGGSIHVESELNKGSQFVFALPVLPVQIESPLTPGGSTSSLSRREPSQWSLPLAVCQELKQQLTQLMQQKSIQRIQDYADLLIQKGQLYPETALAAMGEELVDAVSQFDIGKINEILHELETLCANYEGPAT
jgi:signal transduction histidine kinase